MEPKKNIQEIAQEKDKKLMDIVAWRAGYYRANPHRFVSEVLGIELRLFQKILLYTMMHFNFVMYLAARGQGRKT